MGVVHYFVSWFQKLVNCFDISPRSYVSLVTAQILPKTEVAWTSVTCEVSFGKVKRSIKGTLFLLFLLRNLSASRISG